MERIKRGVALLLLLVFSVTLFSCSKSDTEETDTEESDYVSVAETSDMVLPYSREDGINPFKATSLMNEPIMPLLYQGLYSVSESYEPIAELAASATLSGNNLIIAVDTTKQFSDGTNVTADDVVYSFNKAKKSTYYGTELTYIEEAEATGSKTVTFKLTQKNKYITACLDFPIVKYGTATDNNSVPTGSGLYTYATSEDGGLLTLREEYSKDYSVQQVFLTNTADDEALVNSMSIGRMNAMYDDLSSGSLKRTGASTTQVPLNNLVYIGFNQKTYGWNELENRLYLYMLIDRDNLINTGMDSYGEATTLPFNTRWYMVQNLTGPTGDTKKAKTALKKAFKDHSVTILCCSDNDFKVKTANALQEQLEDAGVTATVNAVPYSQYTKAVSSGSYSIYIGEYKLTNDMNLTKLLAGTELADLYAGVLDGSTTVEDFVNAFFDETPFIPICYRNGMLAYSKTLETTPEVLPNDPYANLPNWTFAD